MLLRFSISNFLSFYDEVTFDMFPNTNRVRFTDHIYNQEVPLLKESAIYGANGSGKSNFVKAAMFFKKFLTQKDFISGLDLKRLRFRLTEQNTKPIRMEMEFVTKGIYYLYKIQISKTVSEELWRSGIGKEEDRMLFLRNGSKVDSELVDNPLSVEKLLDKNPSSSILPLNDEFPVFQSDDVNNVYKWFRDKIVIVDITSWIPQLIHLMSHNEKMLDFASEMLHGCDLNINRLKVGEQSFNDWIKQHRNMFNIQSLLDRELKDSKAAMEFGRDRRNEFNVFIDKDGMRKVQEFLFSQTGVGGYRTDMDISSQSDGTVRLLTLIPAIYDALFEEKTVFIDEIENSIHPNLIFEMILYYSSHRSNGQMIYTTHLSKLMDQQKLLRLDEYWITNKECGQTRMRPLSEFNIHNTIRIENGYLQGRYGGVPNLSIETSEQ